MPPSFVGLHDDARRLLDGWRAPSVRLEAVRTRMIETLATDPTAMWREHSPVHFTASLVVLSAELDAVALTLHAKAKRWFQFGGHLEAEDVSVTAAAFREGVEESGLRTVQMLPGLVQVDAHHLDAAFGWCREHLDLRFAAVAPSRELSVSSESDDVCWWPVGALPGDTDDSLREAIDLAREGALAAKDQPTV